jgi:hypothetical protein
MSQLENNMHNGVIIFLPLFCFSRYKCIKTLDWMAQFVCTVFFFFFHLSSILNFHILIYLYFKLSTKWWFDGLLTCAECFGKLDFIH